jgi:transcriptional regulator with XRE-family HTH domain
MNRAPTVKAPTPLRLAIVQTGRTQREIADEIGLSESRLSQIVNGHWNADEDTRDQIAAAVGRTRDELWPQVTSRAA